MGDDVEARMLGLLMDMAEVVSPILAKAMAAGLVTDEEQQRAAGVLTKATQLVADTEETRR
jgi:hypothetical protein